METQNKSYKNMTGKEFVELVKSYKEDISHELGILLKDVHIPHDIPTEEEKDEYFPKPQVFGYVEDGFITVTLLYNYVEVTIHERTKKVFIYHRLDENFIIVEKDAKWMSNLLIYIEGYMESFIRRDIRKKLVELN